MTFDDTSFEDCVFVNILRGSFNTMYHLLSICTDGCSSHMLSSLNGKQPHRIFNLACHKWRTENLEINRAKAPIC